MQFDIITKPNRYCLNFWWAWNAGKNMYDVDELIDACKLTSRHHQLEPILYDVDHPLVGSAMAPIATALKQVRNNRTKLERRCQKIKIRNLLLPRPSVALLFGLFFRAVICLFRFVSLCCIRFRLFG